MPVFEFGMKPLDYNNPVAALKVMENHIRAMQEQLEWQLAHLDSANVIEISTDETVIKSGEGSAIVGDQIQLSGKNGERFRAGYDPAAQMFRFEVAEAGGQLVMYLSSSGELVISKRAKLSIDCGEW